jgi:hypothetical protein
VASSGGPKWARYVTVAQPDVDSLSVGARVEVRKRFDRSWARGFEIAEVVEHGYVVRRRSDGSLLPAVFGPDDVRPERKREGLWWA